MTNEFIIRESVLAEAEAIFSGDQFKDSWFYYESRKAGLILPNDRELQLSLYLTDKTKSEEVKFMFACFILLMAGEEI